MVQRLGAVNNLRNMVNVLREVSFDEVREDARRTPAVLVVGPSVTDARRLAETTLGVTEGVSTGDFSIPLGDLHQYEAVLVSDGDGGDEAARFKERLRSMEMAPPVFQAAGRPEQHSARVEDLRADLVRRLPERAPALGRAFPALRAAASKAVIDETSMANAQFALVSNIPAIIPIVGSLAAAGADFIVLTKNQAMMIYKLAAIAGRDLDDQIGIIQEIVPVVGIGFAWRSLARGAASMIPFAAGTLPKVAIAYAGTAVMGRAAEFYYRTNMRPTKVQFEGFARQAQDKLQRIPQLIAKRGADGRREGDRSNGSGS